MKVVPGVVVVASLAVLASCDGPSSDPIGGADNGEDPDGAVAPTDAALADAATPDAAPFPFVRCPDSTSPLPPLVEDRSVYAEVAEPARWRVELDIEDLEAFAAVNAGDPDVEVPVVLHDGDLHAAGALRLRGGFSRFNAQKNYKIELAAGARWHGQKEINLNKHMWDLTRLRNKLSFDLMQSVPDLTSLRTQFVELLVNGEGYGLYTWVEEPDKRFLDSHGLDPDGQLYKAAVFWFQEMEPETVADPALLATLIEPKANRDDAKLLRMLDAIHDDARSSAEVLDTYFDRDNLAAWLAFNVLVNDIDSRTQNFYLYSPSSCEGWYLLPWDYDGAWGFYGQRTEDDRERWESGLSNWWVSYLFKRAFDDADLLARVEARIVALSGGTLADAAVAARIASYRDLIEPFISTMPDLAYLPDRPTSPEQAIEIWDGELIRIGSTTSRFLAEYRQVVERPMPMYIDGRPWGAGLRFRWDDSFDLQGDPLSYHVQVATHPGFAPGSVVRDVRGIVDDELHDAMLPAGTYYWRVLAEDGQTSDSWQAPYDPYEELVLP